MEETSDESRRMVYSACVAWFQDWVDCDPPILEDEYDVATWMENEMQGATNMFLTYAFHTAQARNDAIMILRALYYEYFLFQKQLALSKLVPRHDVVDRLPTAPQTPQKSAAWHAESRDMLSGHEFGAVIGGSPAEYANALAKKCGKAIVVNEEEEMMESQITFVTPPEGLTPFKWGWRFEPVARDLFAACFADGVGNVYDGLGRIRHPTLPRLGASPDGLILRGSRSGRLVELKCPITRELDNTIPMRYWIQMQLQAEVCDVDAVEYFEVCLGSSASPTKEQLLRSKLPWIGKVFVVSNDPCVQTPAVNVEEEELPLPSSLRYEYSPLFPATVDGIEEAEEWTPDTEDRVLETITWWVKDYQHQTVLRNRRWWKKVGQPAYETFWRNVEEARRDERFKPKNLPVFVTDDEEDVAATEGVENVPCVLAQVDATGDQTNAAPLSAVSSGVEAWKVDASSPHSDMETSEQCDTGLDLESDKPVSPLHTP